MTVMFPEFFGVPHDLVRLGLMRRMTPSELALYIGLLYESERCRTREFSRSDQQLTALTGVSECALRDARIKLQEHRLVVYQLRPGRRCRYVICDTVTGRPYAGSPKERIQYLRKNTKASAATGAGQRAEKRDDRPETGTPDNSQAPDHDELLAHGVPINFK